MNKEDLLYARQQNMMLLNGEVTHTRKMCPQCGHALRESFKACIQKRTALSCLFSNEWHVFFCKECNVAYALIDQKEQRQDSDDLNGYTAGNAPLLFVAVLEEQEIPHMPTFHQRQKYEENIQNIDARLAVP